MRDDPRRDRSALVVRFAGPYLRRYFRRHFHALRVATDGVPAAVPGQPLIVCTNHPSWWEPVLFALLTPSLFPGRAGYGPIDAAQLGRYGVLRKIGVFGVEQGTRRGAARFLEVGRTLLADPATLLWITGEGAFTDPRRRPVRLRPGVAHLARMAPVMPMAIELSFWNESKPEALVRFGAPLAAGSLPRDLETALEDTMDRLAADSMSRDPARFTALVAGGTGVGGIYDVMRRAQAWAGRRRFDAAHEP